MSNNCRFSSPNSGGDDFNPSIKTYERSVPSSLTQIFNGGSIITSWIIRCISFSKQREPYRKNTKWALLNIRIHSCIIAWTLGHCDLNAVALQDKYKQLKRRLGNCGIPVFKRITALRLNKSFSKARPESLEIT